MVLIDLVYTIHFVLYPIRFDSLLVCFLQSYFFLNNIIPSRAFLNFISLCRCSRYFVSAINGVKFIIVVCKWLLLFDLLCFFL